MFSLSSKNGGLCWLFFPFHDTWGLSWGSSHVSTPQHSIWSRQAEGLYRRALEGGESQLGPQHPHTLVFVSGLALVLEKQGKLEEAGPWSLGCREVAFLALSRGRHFSCGQDETGEFSFPSFTGAIWECELMPRLMYGQFWFEFGKHFSPGGSVWNWVLDSIAVGDFIVKLLS